MKLSILIPTHNYDCTALVGELHRQLTEALPAGDGEIIVGDDGSTDLEVRSRNRALAELEGVRLLDSDVNVGRSRIRNQLADMAQGDYLLFIDSDAQAENPHFLARYLQYLPTQAVICGGLLHPDTLPSPEVSLRWRYEKSCEPRFTAARRNQRPYQNISTFNILIPKNVAMDHPFETGIVRYGYEDTLFGRELEEAAVGVRHIDNPLLHLGLDCNAHFLEKTEEAMHTLYDLRKRLAGQSRLLAVYECLQRFLLTRPLRLAFRLARPLLRRNLLGPQPSVRLFNLYKLGFYATIAHKSL